MRLAAEESRSLAIAERVGRLATVSAAGDPHLVPVTFAVADGFVIIGIDEKPKSTLDLRRLRNIRDNPRVALCWDRYDEDWSLLWWVRADGIASIVESGESWERAWEALNNKYEQYRHAEHHGPVIRVEATKWSGWAHG
ncbi:TIGR03668 family PPOX class F420-dependent oxidoreductase [Microbacterium hominis]|uniref:TIGR03668 family PPOX class F420-dependent oxidoreductase n=1 Tax=Microbacterium hominis TaxID=162426 RepID=A0A7D4UFB5_9MICO|nr:TIGR03668 family PPOX class F420-dependent oxidoreductase [Microbacterium hominis]QKJ18069.1 TIGR03668 family PPOX class F420-dependent oxidoreductase [Microbacterium hominis]